MGVIFAIIGGILKWILLILLGILGLILLVLLILLLTPLRYQLEGEKSSSDLRGRVKVSWLLHLIQFRLSYESKTLRWELKIGPKVLFASYPLPQKPKKVRKAKKQKQTEQPATESTPMAEAPKVEMPKAEMPNVEPSKADIPKAETPAVEPSKADIPKAEFSSKSEESQGQGESREPFPAAPEKKSWRKKVTEFCWKVRRFFEKLVHPVQSLYRKGQGWRARWNEWKEKWEKYPQKGETEQAVKQLLVGLIRPMLPRSFNIWVLYGAEDPATTGKVLGYYYMLWPLLFPKETRRRKITVEADFENSVLEFKGWCRGHFCAGNFLMAVLRAVLNPHIRRLIRYIRANKR